MNYVLDVRDIIHGKPIVYLSFFFSFVIHILSHKLIWLSRYGMRAIYIAKGSPLLPPDFVSMFDDLASSSLDIFFDPSRGLRNLPGLTLGTLSPLYVNLLIFYFFGGRVLFKFPFLYLLLSSLWWINKLPGNYLNLIGICKWKLIQ